MQVRKKKCQKYENNFQGKYKFERMVAVQMTTKFQLSKEPD
jgi:hypothetical protein